MLTVYGSDICIDCRNYRAIQKERGFEVNYIDITANTENLKQFLKMRDMEKCFQAVKDNGGIGIPFFVYEDGRMTLDIDEAFSWIGQPPVREEQLKEKRSVKETL